MIPYGRQSITQADIDAVLEVLGSDFLTQGPAVPRFERAVAQRVGAAHAVAVNSATSALHIACMALGLGKGDLLWTVSNTFVASANCGRYCGADVDFVDIEPVTWNMSVASLRAKLIEAQVRGRLPKIVVPVLFAGQPTQQEEIWELAKQYGFRVLEDASHAIGAARHGVAVGSCRWSDVTVFSFHPVKIITSGEGGAAVTNDPELARSMETLRSHGITRDPRQFRMSDPPAWHYEQQALGFNYRLTDIQAALGTSQLDRLDEYVERRNALARIYDRSLRGLPLQLPVVLAENRSAFHLYVIRLTPDCTKRSRRQVMEYMRGRGIAVNLHYSPVHLQPYYRDLGFTEGQQPEAEAYGCSAITLPLYPALAELEQREVAAALAGAL